MEDGEVEEPVETRERKHIFISFFHYLLFWIETESSLKSNLDQL